MGDLTPPALRAGGTRCVQGAGCCWPPPLGTDPAPLQGGLLSSQPLTAKTEGCLKAFPSREICKKLQIHAMFLGHRWETPWLWNFFGW